MSEAETERRSTMDEVVNTCQLGTTYTRTVEGLEELMRFLGHRYVTDGISTSEAIRYLRREAESRSGSLAEVIGCVAELEEQLTVARNGQDGPSYTRGWNEGLSRIAEHVEYALQSTDRPAEHFSRVTQLTELVDTVVALAYPDGRSSNVVINGLRNELAQSQTNVETAQTEVTSVQNQLTNVQTNLEEANGQNGELQAQLAAMTNERDDANNTANDLVAARDSALATVAQRETTIQNREARIRAFEGQVASERRRAKGFQTQVVKAEAAVGALQCQVDALPKKQERLAAVTATLAERDGELAALQQRHGQVCSLPAQMEALQELMATMEQENQTLHDLRDIQARERGNFLRDLSTSIILQFTPLVEVGRRWVQQNPPPTTDINGIRVAGMEVLQVIVVVLGLRQLAGVHQGHNFSLIAFVLAIRAS